MGTNNSYTDAQILKGLRKHIVTGKMSKYTLYKPMTWQGVLKRMEKSPDLAAKVHSIVAEADAIWEQIGITALESGDQNFNVALFKMYVTPKKAFQSYEVNELDERIQRLEDEH